MAWNVITWIRNEIRAANEAVRKGDEYRVEKYGKDTMGFEDSMAFAREIHRRYVEECVPKRTTQTTDEIVAFVKQYQYQRTWTGARFETEEVKGGNKNGLTCTSDLVTGEWKTLPGY